MSKNVGHMGLIALLLLGLIVPLFSQTTYAQDDTQVVIAGSTYLDELMRVLTQNFTDTTETETEFTFQAEGLTAGFEALCAGSVDLVMSTRPISDEELLGCETDFIEVLLAVEGLVLIPDMGITATLNCTTSDNLSNILGAGANEQLTWLDVSPTATSPDELTLYGPERDISTFLASLLPSEQARDDYETFATLNDVIEQLQTPGSNTLVFTTLSEWAALSEEERGDVRVLDITADDFTTCVSPTIEAVEEGNYALGRRLMLYVNANNLEKVSPFLNFALEEEGITTTTSDLGFSTPTTASLEAGRGNIIERRTGRTFSRPESPVATNTAEQGSIAIHGSSIASYRADIVYTAFNSKYAAVTLDVTPLGDTEGWQAFCGGEVDVLQVSRQATEEELATCRDNDINPTQVFLGSDAVVLVVSNEELPTCVSYEDIRTLIVNDSVDVDKGMMDDSEDVSEAPTEETEDSEEQAATPQPDGPQGPTDWSQFGADVPLLILPPALGSLENDLVFTEIAPGEFLLRRTDVPTVQEVPENTDLEAVDYRLGAIPNYEGGALTWAFWSEVQARDIEGLRPLEVGSDCVAPSVETISDGSYPFSVSSYLVFSDVALGDAFAGALLWDLLSEETAALLTEAEVIGIDRETLVEQRESLFNIIAQAQTARIEAEGEVTEEGVEEETGTEEGSENGTVNPDGSVNPDGTVNEDGTTGEEATPNATPQEVTPEAATPEEGSE
ncbi:MAG: substrate-binding domain-containing protein [Chloroflexi bacterium]|nr:substrate-binding domain-containing protein [Chloroflexota bacterium]